MKRTKLCDRPIPNYPKNIEIANIITHSLGILMGVIVLIACVVKASACGPLCLVGVIIYGITMIGLFTISTIYHSRPRDRSKLVMQVWDHCAIYSFISGTYTPVLLCAMAPEYPTIAWGLLAVQWTLTAIATTMTAIDLLRFRTVALICYIGMGWSIILFSPQTIQVLSAEGFWLVLGGGIVYTLGALCFLFDRKYVVMHTIFHGFVLAGTLMQALAIYFYAI